MRESVGESVRETEGVRERESVSTREKYRERVRVREGGVRMRRMSECDRV